MSMQPPFLSESSLTTKDRSNSFEFSLGEGMATLYLPTSFTREDIHGIMLLAKKFEQEEE